MGGGGVVAFGEEGEGLMVEGLGGGAGGTVGEVLAVGGGEVDDGAEVDVPAVGDGADGGDEGGDVGRVADGDLLRVGLADGGGELVDDLFGVGAGCGEGVGGGLDGVDEGVEVEVEERANGFAGQIALVEEGAAVGTGGLDAQAVGGLGGAVGVGGRGGEGGAGGGGGGFEDEAMEVASEGEVEFPLGVGRGAGPSARARRSVRSGSAGGGVGRRWVRGRCRRGRRRGG